MLTRLRRAKGFTLMEVMISIVIITIAFFAVLATQGTALDGYSSTKDLTGSSDVARAVIEQMQLEGSGWKSGSFDSGVPVPYVATDAPYKYDSLLKAVQGNGWAAWTSLNDDPKDARGASGAAVPGRYCIYARGDYLEMDTEDVNSYDDTTNDFLGSPIFQAQVVVVYPGPNGNLTDCTTLDTTLFAPDDTTLLEATGLRASYFGTVVVRREYAI